ncbi:MAG: ATP-dependent Clp protease proteolytic subunit [Clostridia bacterium]|nr:ATP-dependent Clp protease proteolytic subunit [Clostridia bacterium]
MDEKENTEKQGVFAPEEEIVRFGSTARENSDGIFCITVIGQIEGHYTLGQGNKATKYEHLLPLIVNAEENEEVKGLLVIINTVGGDVEAGLAIAELLSTMSKPTVSLVIGGGHSIGVPIAVSCRRSFIVPSATMTLHPVRITGTVLGVWQSFDYLSRMQKRITDFVVSHSAVTQENFEKLLCNTEDMTNDVGTIIDGKRAVELGIIDELGGLSPALSSLREMIKEGRGQA